MHGGTAQNFLPKVEVFYAVLTEACPAVTALFADSITNTSASISWTASDADYCVGNQIIVSPIPLDSAELDTTTPTTVSDTVTSHIITGLTPDHNYNVYLRTLCNGSDHNEGSSNWATTVFRTFPNVRVPEIQWARVNGKHSAKVKVLNTGLDLGQPTHYDYIVSSILLDATVLDSITPTASGIDTSCFEISGLQSSTRYFLYFRNVFGGEISPWSIPDSITMPPEMPAVINLGVINIAHNALTATWQSDTANYADETAWRTAIAPHDSISATSEWVTVTEALTAHAGMHPFIGLYTDSAYDIYVCAFNPVTGATSDTVVLDSVRTTDFPSPCETFGTATTTSDYFFPGYFGYLYAAMLYEIDQTGTIESIAVNSTSNKPADASNMELWVKVVDGDFTFTNQTTFAILQAGAMQIFNGTPGELTAGWINFPFNSPVSVSNGQQLLVLVRGVGCTAVGGCRKGVSATSVSGKFWHKAQDSSDPTSSATGSVILPRPDMQLCYIRTSNCLPINTLYLTNLTDSTACFSWYPGNEETSWQYTLSDNDTLNDNLLDTIAQVITTANINLTGLVHDSTYCFYLRPVCSATENGPWSRHVFTASHVDFYDITVLVNDSTMGTANSHTNIRQGSEITLTAVANEGYEFYKWVLGNNTMYFDNSLTLIADSNIVVHAYFRHAEASISASEITFWAGTGDNQAILAVNWREAALAWGIRFAADTIPVQAAMDTITAADPRFSYSIDNHGQLDDIRFIENGTLLSDNIWESKNNGETDRGLNQTLMNGDFEKWCTPAAGFVYDSVYSDNGSWHPLYTYPMAINAVTAPQFFNIIVQYDSTMGTVTGIPENSVFAGTLISLTAIANEGFIFTGWSNGETNEHYDFFATEDVNIEAFFEANTIDIEDVTKTEVFIYSSNGNIIIKGIEGLDVSIYDVSGRCLFSQSNAPETIQHAVSSSGIYLIKVADIPIKSIIVNKK